MNDTEIQLGARVRRLNLRLNKIYTGRVVAVDHVAGVVTIDYIASLHNVSYYPDRLKTQRWLIADLEPDPGQNLSNDYGEVCP